ncbi:hypothetical protein KY285_019360 [Solanum tuberosum]|nr:hypothetical protein KY285_019360 [Solanum tuberosum]
MFHYTFVLAAGIVLFLIVDKLVRYVEDFSGGVNERSHGHHHHHHMHYTKLKDDNDADDKLQELSQEKDGILSEKAAGVDGVSADSPNGDKPNGGAILRKVESIHAVPYFAMLRFSKVYFLSGLLKQILENNNFIQNLEGPVNLSFSITCCEAPTKTQITTLSR